MPIHTDSSIQMPHRQTKKTQLALCPNYPFASGSVFKSVKTVLTATSLCLNPFESGSVFKHLCVICTSWRTGLNPFESGFVFKQVSRISERTQREVLIPLNQGLFLNQKTVGGRRCVRGLNPFESGSIFKHSARTHSTLHGCRLNPFESGSVFKPVGCWIFFSYQFSAKQLSNFFLVAKAVSFFHSCRIFYLLPTRLCYASCRRRQCAMSRPTVLLLSLRGLQTGDASDEPQYYARRVGNGDRPVALFFEKAVRHPQGSVNGGAERLDRIALVSGQVGLNLKNIGCVHADGSDGGDGSQDTDLFFVHKVVL